MSARYYRKPVVGDVVETEHGPAIVEKVKRRGAVAVVRDAAGYVWEASRPETWWTVWA